MGKMTKARLTALKFIRDNEPVKLFPIPGPSLRLVRKMAAEGLVLERPSGPFGFVRYLLSPAGRSALEEHNGK